ncbi:hypothetical protein QBC47DRAFT_453672 [Echria macrotheca]|uniref:Uncharacterized protein n=1 Tax=Echria macrotheca TaxID=438768 RepID=A0AAJ0F745_9PEZI|nr:hypothetical protein QBC47DRAFT_453672 [Echria macrotheca]
MESDTEVPYTQFACIGTGFSGIGLGATLRRWYDITDIKLFERGADLGGTWTVNQYPGAACDVPSALYSFSFATNPTWTRILPSAAELRAYLQRVADDYDLPSKMVFNTAVERCEWIEERARWRLTVRDLVSGETSLHECQFLFSGAGQFSTPRELDVPGLQNFKGEVMHSARWRPEVDLRNKNVVVFGNGCTAAQIVPSILPLTKHVTQIVRSKHWIMPPVDRVISKRMAWWLEHTPGMLWLQRFIIFWLAEADFPAYVSANSGYRKARQSIAERYMRKAAPKKYHDLLIPEFDYGTKRRVFDSGYLKALHADNMTLTNEPAVEILENGVRLRNGDVVAADVLVLANGFQLNELQGDIKVSGRNGKTIEDHWDEFGGAEAYNCTSLSGFPNFFFLLGPNTVTGHTSTVMAIENAINYALRVIRPVLEGRLTIVDVKREAEEAYVAKVHRALEEMVWANGGSKNWYTKELEVGGVKRTWNGMTYPWWQGHYWYHCLFPVWRDWQYGGKPCKPTIAKRRAASRWLLTFVFLALGGVAASRWARSNPDSRLAAAAMRLAMLCIPGNKLSGNDLASRVRSGRFLWKS